MHYSYDVAQQVHFPKNPLQPGPAYFLTAHKCQILVWQVNYLIDEADVVGKGVVSFITCWSKGLRKAVKLERYKVLYCHHEARR